MRCDSSRGAADLPPDIDATLSGEAGRCSFQSWLMPLAQQPQSALLAFARLPWSISR